MYLYLIRRRTAWDNPAQLQATAEKSGRIGDQDMSDRIRWIRSYVVREADGRLGTVCIYQARDPDAIKEHARRVGMPMDEVQSVIDTVVVRADPETAAAMA